MTSVSHNSSNIKSPCGICQKWVFINHNRALQCSNCLRFIHHKCSGLTFSDYQQLQLSKVWFCKLCMVNIFPFSSLNDFEFCTLSNTRKPSDIELLPSLDIISRICSLNSLDMSDIESNIPNPINSKYYFPSDFEKLTLQASSSYLSLFHIDINSLHAHLSDLQTTLASLNFLFHIIGISETRENICTGFKMMVRWFYTSLSTPKVCCWWCGNLY